MCTILYKKSVYTLASSIARNVNKLILMKRTTSAWLVILFCLSLGAVLPRGYGQCPSGELTFSSQAQIDAFPIVYPGCRELTGSIFIFDGGDGVQDISNLNALSGIQRIDGSLQIALNASLTDISGLAALQEVTGGVAITDNDQLQSLEGLSALRRVGENLRIRNNDALNACCGLAPLLFAEGVEGSITIEGNAAACNSAEDIVASCCVSQVSLSGPAAVCEGIAPVLQAATSGAVEAGCQKVQLEQSYEGAPFTTVETLSISTDGSYDFSALNNLAPGDYQFRARLSECTEAACAALSPLFSLSVIASPAPADAETTIYSCTSVRFDLAAYSGLEPDATFEWELSTVNTALSGASAGIQSSALIDDVLTNTSNIAQTLIYSVVPTTVEGCEGPPFEVKVTVRPKVEVAGCLACNNTINVTLNDDCRMAVTLGMVAEGEQGGICENFELLKEALEVVVYDGVYPGQDANSADNIVDGTGLFDYQIELRAGYEDCFIWVPCWGSILAEDKSAPQISCPEEVIGLVKTEVTAAEAEAIVDGAPYAFRPGIASDAGCAREAVCSENCDPASEGFNYLICNDVDSVLQQAASYDDPSYPYYTGSPEVTDCSEYELVGVSDELIDAACGDLYYYGRPVAAIIERSFRYRDAAGNADTCVQKIFFFRPELLLPECELNFERCDFPDLNTGNASELLDPVATGSAPYYFNGICERLYLTEHTCQLTVAYEDEIFEGEADCGVKVVRRWSFLDWCWKPGQNCDDFRTPATCADALRDWNNKTRIYEQVLLIKDQTEPLVSCPAMRLFPTGPFNCTAVVNPPDPIVTEECGDWDWEFELYGEVTNPKTGITLPNQLIAASVNQVASGIAPGNYDLHYLVTDECGNTSRAICPILVADQIEPVTICNDDLNVSIGGANTSAQGVARIAVEDVDEGSWDNCAIAKLEARRLIDNGCINSYTTQVLGLTFPEDFTIKRNSAANVTYYLLGSDTLIVNEQGTFYSWWADAVFFTCCDISSSPAGKARIELRATDVSGNTNICWLQLTVEDKLPPSCSVGDASILCTELDFDPSAPAQVAARFGTAEEVVDLRDNCGATLEENLVWSPASCGTGVIERIFTATDASGGTATCVQTITVEEVNRYTITFPGDKNSAECGVAPVDTLLYGSQACDLLALNRDTTRFEASGDECFKQFITYEIVNWCEYDGESVKPTIISRDLDQDKNLEERTWLEAELDPVFVQRYLPGETEPFIVKLFAADASGGQEALPERVLVRAQCSDRPALVGYRIWKRQSNGAYAELCRRSVDGICEEQPVEEQCWTPGYYQYTQINKIYDNVAPEIALTSDQLEFCAYGSPATSCDGQTELTFNVTDGCTPEDLELREVRLLLDQNPNQAIGPEEGLYQVIQVEDSWLLSGKLPIGEHRYILRFADGCGNISSERVDISVIDCKAPAPICINGVAVELMAIDTNDDGIIDGGQNTVWATDLVASMSTDCSGEVTYSINMPGETPDRAKTSLTLTCEDPLFETLPVEVYAWDEAGNRDLCETFIVVEDLNELCEPSGSGGISGLIITEQDEPVAQVQVSLSGQRSAVTTTAGDGLYGFEPLQEGYDFTVLPERDGDYLNGVSTFDLVLISKHILGVQPLNSPYKLIAADANKSGSVTTLDLILLRKLILNVNTDLPGNTSWRFVPLAYNFPNPANPFSTAFPELLNVNNLTGEITNGDFIGIKVGDVNLSARPNNFTPVEERGTAGTFRIVLEDQTLSPGDPLDIPFTAAEMSGIQGYQFSLHLDPAVEILDVQEGLASGHNFGLFPERGLLTTSWNDTEVSGAQRLFTLRLRAKRTLRLSEALRLSARPTTAEAYRPEGEALKLVLDFDYPVRNRVTAPVLHQNAPNPFREITRIGFELPEYTDARLLFHDAGGRLLKVIRGAYPAGYHELVVNRSDIPGAGMVFYTLEVGKQQLTRSMLIQD